MAEDHSRRRLLKMASGGAFIGLIGSADAAKSEAASISPVQPGERPPGGPPENYPVDFSVRNNRADTKTLRVEMYEANRDNEKQSERPIFNREYLLPARTSQRASNARHDLDLGGGVHRVEVTVNDEETEIFRWVLPSSGVPPWQGLVIRILPEKTVRIGALKV